MTERAAIDRHTSDAMLRGERWVSAARVVFTVAVAARGVVIWNVTPEGAEAAQAWLTGPTLLLTALVVAFSGLAVFAPHQFGSPRRLVRLSVTLDAVVAFALLASNPLWPWPGWPGLPMLPDLGALLVVTLAAGLRALPSGALLGAGLNLAGYGGLVAIDLAVSGLVPGARPHHYLLWAAYVLGAGALTVFVALWLSAQARQQAQATHAAAQTAEVLEALRRDHHDVRSLLTSVLISSDLAARRAGQAPPSELKADLGEAIALLDAMRLRVAEHGPADARREVVLLPEGGSPALEAVRSRFPNVDVTLTSEGSCAAWMAGGALSLQRVLLNLLMNACEGDGHRRASAVRVLVEPDGAGRVVVRVEDDGPGFGAAGSQLKPGGSGTGLLVVNGLVKASGGEVSLGVSELGGAAVSVSLEAAPRP